MGIKGGLLVMSMLAAAVSPAWGINKCTVDGKTVYQDAPCGLDSKKSETVKTWGGNTTASRPASAYRVDPDLQMDATPSAAPILAFYRRWADAEKLAMATARIALAQPVSNLQALQREIEAHAEPSCLTQAKADLVKLVAANVKVMINFMQKEELSGMVYQFVERAKLVRTFEASTKLAKCE